jgi:hypothetical protein
MRMRSCFTMLFLRCGTPCIYYSSKPTLTLSFRLFPPTLPNDLFPPRFPPSLHLPPPIRILHIAPRLSSTNLLLTTHLQTIRRQTHYNRKLRPRLFSNRRDCRRRYHPRDGPFDHHAARQPCSYARCRAAQGH